MELNITHLQYYPIGGENALSVQKKGTDWNYQIDSVSVEGVTTNTSFSHYWEYDEIKPLLLPLSALYEEIDGEIGIICLAKLAASKSLTDKGEWILGNEYDVHGNAFRVVRNSFLLAVFYYHESTQSFHFLTNNVELVIPQLALFEYLFSHHYDVYDLCSKGIAIDKRSVK